MAVAEREICLRWVSSLVIVDTKEKIWSFVVGLRKVEFLYVLSSQFKYLHAQCRPFPA